MELYGFLMGLIYGYFIFGMIMVLVNMKDAERNAL